jgi:hypothetical protein
MASNPGEILRFAQNDRINYIFRINYFFRSL